MLTPFRSVLLALPLATASLLALPTPTHAGPCEAAGNGGPVPCVAEGENPGGPGNDGGGGGGGGGGNNGPGNGPGDNGNPGIAVNVDPPEAPLPNTEDTIAKAFNKIEFPVPTIETAPEPKTFVRVKTSFWIPAAQAEDLTTQAAVGAPEGVQPQVITATAELKYILWDLVEDEMICEGPGRPNGEGAGEECDYHFKTSSVYHGVEAFEITATPYWNITWACEGVCPDGAAGVVDAEYASPAGEVDLIVDEIQTEANDN